MQFNPKRYGLFRWSKVWGGEESNHTCFWAPTWPSHVQMTHRWSQMKADTLIHLTFWNITLLSLNNCWIRSGWIPHPPIHLTHFFCRISKFSKIFIHNPNYWNSPRVLNILNYNYMRFDGHSFIFLKERGILMTSGRNPHPPITFRVKSSKIFLGYIQYAWVIRNLVIFQLVMFPISLKISTKVLKVCHARTKWKCLNVWK